MILPLEKQVASLELSKELKANGFEQDTLWIWNDGDINSDAYIVSCDDEFSFSDHTKLYAAPTSAEIAEVLPWRSKKMNTINDAQLVCVKIGDKYRIMYCDEDKELYLGIVADSGHCNTLVNAMAKMTNFLYKNKLIKEL